MCVTLTTTDQSRAQQWETSGSQIPNLIKVPVKVSRFQMVGPHITGFCQGKLEVLISILIPLQINWNHFGTNSNIGIGIVHH